MDNFNTIFSCKLDIKFSFDMFCGVKITKTPN